MSDELMQVGKVQAHVSASGTRILRYSLEVFHKGLNEHKVISAPDGDMLQNKARLQLQKWSDIWDAIEEKRKVSELKGASIERAASLSEEAKSALEAIDNLLTDTLSIDDKINWEKIKRKDDFLEAAPQEPKAKKELAYPPEPTRSIISFSFFEKLIKSKRNQKISAYEKRFQIRLREWETEKREVVDKSNFLQAQEQLRLVAEWKKNLLAWDKNRVAFLAERLKFNEKINLLKLGYQAKNNDSIVEYCDMVLSNSAYPVNFPKNFEIEYIPSTKILIVEYQLPSLADFPSIKEVKYISTRNELKESHISESQQIKMFDESLYKIALRTLHELFEADAVDAIEAISLNGWVNAINKATGKEENNCILSIQVKKTEFVNIDLGNVDPKVCFRNLKGVASSKLSSITPVQPIMQISKTDKRFVDGYDVAHSVDTSTNLAAMNWEDFEHLIREIFEKEFQVNGGEVKITQASRDGGVDAVAFDPDPIRGGKIVIQAKRYTNTVGVSAVRDLYGTTMNEGATKGILVSTADYGPDAYEFAKGKPLTLLNGSNLLHLLQKHGYHAKIDLREAKKILSEGT